MAVLAPNELSEVAELVPVRIEVSEEQFEAFNALIDAPMEFTEKLESLAKMPSPFHHVTDERIASLAQGAGKSPINFGAVPAPFIPILED